MCKKIEQEFEDFFLHCEIVTNCDQKEIRKILRPLKNHLIKQQLVKAFKIFFIVAAICFGIFFFDSINWHFCAVGRLFLIKLLPIWNWTQFENARCLITRASPSERSNDDFREISGKDCRACENFDTIDVYEQASYNFIRDKFLLRGLPIIVGDNFGNLHVNESLSDFIENIPLEMMEEEACNLETNLMLLKFASVGETFGILNEMKEDLPPWFISFRNCKFKALKASRSLIRKPYFYPRNLQAPSSSWLLMSQNYGNYSNDLKLFGLIIVTQSRDSIRITLKAKPECVELCKDLTMNLFAGESLVFLSHLYTFTYEFSAEKDFSVTFITETDFN